VPLPLVVAPGPAAGYADEEPFSTQMPSR